MKWLLLMFSVVKPLLSSAHANGHETLNPINDIKDMIKENSMKVVSIFAYASVLSTLFAAGIIIIAVSISSQYDLNNMITFNAMIATGLGLSLVSSLIGYLVLRSYQGDSDIKTKVPEKQVTISREHPLHDAIALLVTDFIKEREYKREYKRQVRESRAPLAPFRDRTSQEDSTTLISSDASSNQYESKRH